MARCRASLSRRACSAISRSSSAATRAVTTFKMVSACAGESMGLRVEQRDQAERLAAGSDERHSHVAVDAHVHEPLVGRERALNLGCMVS